MCRSKKNPILTHCGGKKFPILPSVNIKKKSHINIMCRSKKKPHINPCTVEVKKSPFYPL